MMDEPRVMFIEIPAPKSRSVSPSTLSPSACRDRFGGVFDMISRRFGRRSHDELCFHTHGEEDSRSSSTDSCSSTSGRIAIVNSNLELHCSTSDSSSNDSNDITTAESQHRRSSSSIRKAIQNLTISSRSLSCSAPNSEQKVKKNKKVITPKRILRQPVTYTYVKGISGLPKRVPRSSVCCHQTHR